MRAIAKRILIFVLSLSFVLTALPAAATNEDIALFQAEALNLFEKEADGSTDWAKTITRAEFSHVMSVLLGHENDGIGYSLSDVDETTPYRGEIYNMLLMGLMNGDGNGRFRPLDNITLYEAATVMLRTLGYSHLIANKEYPQAVLSCAISLRMLDNIRTSGSFTRRDFAMMLHNSFDINLMSESFTTGENKEYYKSDIKFGDVIFNANGEGSAYYGVGIVMQNAMSFVDVSYKKLEINEVIIDGVLYDTGDMNVAELLGMEVRFLAKEQANGSYVLMNIAPTEKNDIVRFDAADFKDYEPNNALSYLDENDKKQKVRINADTRIIKNYDTISSPSDSIFLIDSGEYTAIDNNNDSIADVIMIFSYENTVVSGVYNNVVTLKEGFSVNGTRYINLDEEENDLLYYVTDSDGIPIDINSVSGESVISVATDRTGEIMKIVVRKDALITHSLDAVGNGKFYIEDVEYDVLTTEEYKIGNKYDFYLNFKNDIIYFKIADDGEETKYGYVMAVESGRFRGNQIELLVSKKVDFGIEINDEDADNVTQIPMLICQNEEILILDMADKVRVDGNRIDSDDIESRISSGDKLYKFELNSDGELKSLETAEFKAGSLYQTFTYNIYDKCFGMGSKAYEGFAINENSQIVCIPMNPTCDEDYMVKTVINQEGNTIGYNVRGYDYDPITKKCGLIVINREMKYYDLPGVTVDSSKAAIVKDIRNVLTEDDTYVAEIEFIEAGEVKKMHLTEAAADVNPTLKEGDLFTYTADYENRISNFMVIRSMSALTSDFTGTSGLASGASETFGSLLDISYDEVDELTTALAMEFYVDVNGNVNVVNVPQRNKPPIYVYDGREDIYAGGIEDVVPGSDKVYVFMSDAITVAAVVVVK